MHRILLLLSEMLHSCLLILKSKQTCIFFFDTSHLCCLTEELNALMICHHITCYYSKYDAVMKMQYILFYKPDFCHAFCLDFSLLTRCYCWTNSPNISYAMSRLLTFKLPLLTYIWSQNVRTTRGLHSTQLSFSPCRFLGLGDPRYARGLTTNNVCLSVCKCHKTPEIKRKRLDSSTHL